VRQRLRWKNAKHEVEWDDSPVTQKDFSTYLDGYLPGEDDWDTNGLRESLWRHFDIRVNVQRSEPTAPGGLDHFEVVTAEGLARGVGATAPGGPLPPVR
jgi:hypothetical protein